MEHPADARLEGIGRHGSEQRRRPHLVVHVGPGRAAADRIHPRQVGGGPPQGVHDLVDVPLRVGLVHRVPEDLLAEHDLAVDHGGGLAVAGTEVEADPAAVEVAAQRDGGLALGRELGLGDADDLERDAEQLRAHERGVEDAGGLRRVVPGQVRDQGGGPVDVQPRAAARPQEELAQAFHRPVRGGLVRVARRGTHASRCQAEPVGCSTASATRIPPPPARMESRRPAWARAIGRKPGSSGGDDPRHRRPPSCRPRPVEPARARA